MQIPRVNNSPDIILYNARPKSARVAEKSLQKHGSSNNFTAAVFSSQSLIDNNKRAKLAIVPWSKCVRCRRRIETTGHLGRRESNERTLEDQYSGPLTRQ